MKRIIMITLAFVFLIPSICQSKDLIYSTEYCVVCSNRLSIEYIYAIAKQGDTEAAGKVLAGEFKKGECVMLLPNQEYYLMGREGDIVLVRPKGETFVLWSVAMDWSRSPVQVKSKKPKVGM